MTAQSRQKEKVARATKIRSIPLQFRSSMAIRVSVRVEAGSGQRVRRLKTSGAQGQHWILTCKRESDVARNSNTPIACALSMRSRNDGAR
jgi:hypothetical protein